MSHAHPRAPKNAGAFRQPDEKAVVPAPMDGALESAMAEFEESFAAFCGALDRLQQCQSRKATRDAQSLAAHPVEPLEAPPCESVESADVSVDADVATPAAAPSTPSDSAALPSAEPDDDESLLAKLDSVTANAIRVRRRLTKRSVKELLAERQSMPAEPAVCGVKPAKKAWWRFCL